MMHFSGEATSASRAASVALVSSSWSAGVRAGSAFAVPVLAMVAPGSVRAALILIMKVMRSKALNRRAEVCITPGFFPLWQTTLSEGGWKACRGSDGSVRATRCTSHVTTSRDVASSFHARLQFAREGTRKV